METCALGFDRKQFITEESLCLNNTKAQKFLMTFIIIINQVANG